MKKKELYALIFGLLIFLVVIGLIVKDKFFSAGAGGGSAESVKTLLSSKEIKFPLKLGSGYSDRPLKENEAVKILQTALNKQYKEKNKLPSWGVSAGLLVVDGKFGAKTEKLLNDLTGFKVISQDKYKEYAN